MKLTIFVRPRFTFKRPLHDYSRFVNDAAYSFGGIISQLLASRDLGLRAAINSAGAAQSWSGSSHLREALLDAAGKARVPVLLLQAENDYDLTPTRQIAEAMSKAGHAHEVRIFPSFGSNTAEGHSFGYFGSQVWGDAVLAFLRRNMK